MPVIVSRSRSMPLVNFNSYSCSSSWSSKLTGELPLYNNLSFAKDNDRGKKYLQKTSVGWVKWEIKYSGQESTNTWLKKKKKKVTRVLCPVCSGARRNCFVSNWISWPDSSFLGGFPYLFVWGFVCLFIYLVFLVFFNSQWSNGRCTCGVCPTPFHSDRIRNLGYVLEIVIIAYCFPVRMGQHSKNLSGLSIYVF